MDIWGWLSSASVLETVFDGVLGSVIGALVAMLVLWLSLTSQRETLDEQLRRQDEHHAEQIRVQRGENTRARLITVVAEILRSITRCVPVLEQNGSDVRDGMQRIWRDVTVDLERFNLDIAPAEHGMYDVVAGLLKTAFEGSAPEDHGPLPQNRQAGVMSLLTATGSTLTEWARGDADRRRELEEFGNGVLEQAKSLHVDDWEEAFRKID